jgi:hypothetical protein
MFQLHPLAAHDIRKTLFHFSFLILVSLTPLKGNIRPSQGATDTGLHKHRINEIIHNLSRIQTHNPSVRARAQKVPALDTAAILIGCTLNVNKEIAVSRRRAGAVVLLTEVFKLLYIKLHN